MERVDLLQQIKRDLRNSSNHYSDWRTTAKENYNFYSSEQWSEEDKSILLEQGRVPVVFNRVARTVNGIIGLEVQNRQEPRFLPREMTDGAVSETITQAVKWVRDNCDAEDEESDAFTDTVICGMGWTETLISYENDQDGEILVERRDPLKMYADPDAKKRNLDDAKFVARIAEYTLKEFEEKFPDAESVGGTFFGMSDEDEQPHVSDPNDGYRDGDVKSDKKIIEVAQYQYYDVEKVHRVIDLETGEDSELSPAKAKVLMEVPRYQVSRKAREKRVYKQVLCTPTEILEETTLECNGFTLRCITGFRDRNNNLWFGVVDLMKDPQRWANKWLSQIQHILNTQAKSGKVVLESGAVQNPKKFREEWADPALPAIVNPGAISQNKFMQIQPAQYPQGLDRLLQYAMDAVNDTAGANMELLGLANRQQAGVLEESRKQAGMTMFAAIFDSLRRYRKEQGRILAEYIRLYIADGRLMRVVGETGAQYIPLLRDKMAMKYDIVMDDAPSSPNMKERTFAVLNQILPVAMQSGIPVPPDVLDYAPLPEQLSQKWKGFISKQAEDPEAQQAKQLGMEAQAAETDGKKAKAALDIANAQKAMAEAQTMGSDNATGLELAKHESELQAKLMMKQLELESQERIAAMKTEADIKTKESIASMASKPSTTFQLGGDEIALSLADMLKEMSAQNAAMMQAMLTSQQQQTQFLAQSINDSMGQVAHAMRAPKRIVEENGKPVGMVTVN